MPLVKEVENGTTERMGLTLKLDDEHLAKLH